MSFAAGLEVGAPLVFIAGLASFLSPCVLPLLPGYLAYMSGQSIELVRAGQARATKMLLSTLFFVLGFTTVFVALGTTASLLGSILLTRQRILSQIAGVLIVVMGLAFMGVLPIPWLYSEKRFDLRRGVTLPRNYLMGLAFGFGWSPCIGPTLGVALGLAAQTATAPRGALLLFVYSLGLGVPFILAAAGVSRLTGALKWLGSHQKAVVRVAGGLLVVFGLLLFFGEVFRLSSWMQRWMQAAGLEELVGI